MFYIHISLSNKKKRKTYNYCKLDLVIDRQVESSWPCHCPLLLFLMSPRRPLHLTGFFYAYPVFYLP